MLRINLLPAYLAEQRKVKLAIVLASALFVLVTAGMLGYHFGVVAPATEQARKDAEDMKVKEEAATAKQKEAQDTLAKVQPIIDKVDFVKDVRFHNGVRSSIFENAARYTIKEVEYGSMAVNASAFQASAYCQSLADLGRLYLTLWNNPDFNAVSVQGIPGWPNAASEAQKTGQPIQGGNWFPVTVAATMVKPVVTPQLPASLGAGGQQGGFPGGGFGGAPGGGFSGSPGTSSGPPPGYSGGAGGRPGGPGGNRGGAGLE